MRCTRHFEVYTVPHLLRNLHLAVHMTKVCHEICTPWLTPHSPALVFRNKALPKTSSKGQYEDVARCCSQVLAENEPHVQSSRRTAPATNSERAKDDRQVQSASPARNLRAAPISYISCMRHEKSTLNTKTRGFPRACHEN